MATDVKRSGEECFNFSSSTNTFHWQLHPRIYVNKIPSQHQEIYTLNICVRAQHVCRNTLQNWPFKLISLCRRGRKFSRRWCTAGNLFMNTSGPSPIKYANVSFQQIRPGHAINNYPTLKHVNKEITHYAFCVSNRNRLPLVSQTQL